MPEEIFYRFDNIRVSSLRPQIFHDGKPTSLTPTAFGLLLVFVQNPGHTFTKTALMKRVWTDNVVTDNNFNVTLNAVRRALRETAREPRYLFKVPNGYRFVADVREVKSDSAPTSQSDMADAISSSPLSGSHHDTPRQPGDLVSVSRPHEWSGHQLPMAQGVRETRARAPIAHMLVSCCLYAVLYTCALFLELAYRWDVFWKVAVGLALPVFVLVFGTSLAALKFDWNQTSERKGGGLIVSCLSFVAAAVLLYAGLGLFLPNHPITEANFQARSAHAAYLKNVSYFLPLGLIFIAIPFHFVVAAFSEVQSHPRLPVLALLNHAPDGVAPRGAIYLRVWWLGLLLCGAAIVALVFTNHLLDNLQPGPYKNFFTQLVTWRLLLYFGLGLQCILWYSRALSDIKRQLLSETT